MREELLRKANEILEKTKNEQEKYEAERKVIYWLMEHVSDGDINMLEYMEKLYEKISKVEKENEQYNKVKEYAVNNGYYNITLHAYNGNEAVEFYKKLGMDVMMYTFEEILKKRSE